MSGTAGFVRLVPRLNERAFAFLPSAVDKKGRRVSQCLSNLDDDVAVDHVHIIDHQVDDNQPRASSTCTFYSA